MPVPNPSSPRPRVTSSLLAAACVLAALTSPMAARADDDEPESDLRPYRVQRPTAVRLGGALLALPREDELFVFADATVARQLLKRLAVEGSAGVGGTQLHRGLHLELAARGTLLGTQRGAFTAELGTHGLFLGGLGAPLAFGHAGLAFELRKREGLSFIAGGGLALVFTDSRRRAGGCEERRQGCYRYRAGSRGLWVNIQAGTSF